MPTLTRALSLALLSVVTLTTAAAAQEAPGSYKVLATSKTSTMQKEMAEAAAAGFRYVAVMGGGTSFGGSEVVVIMGRVSGKPQFEYRLLATSKTSTMQKELQDASEAGFDYVGQTVFKSTFGGSEVACILERDRDGAERPRREYKLLATNKTSTLQKELQEAVEQGFEVIGLTVGETFGGGSELVTIMRRRAR